MSDAATTSEKLASPEMCVDAGVAGDAGDEGEDDFGFTPTERRKILRRIDRRLILMVGCLYCVSLMDRNNMGFSNIAGMGHDLKLTGNRYNIANLAFFATYIVFQSPSTVLVRALGPRIHLSLIALCWGAVMIGMGFVTTAGQLTALRSVLGVFEAGFFPSCLYLLSTWYTRYEVGRRFSVFYIIGCVASAFSGILAFGLMQLKGRQGLNGWQWIFILQGTLTCALSPLGYLLLVDFPDSPRPIWNFLTPRERSYVVQRIHRDRGDSHIPSFDLAGFLSGAADLKIWLYALIFFNTTTITYALNYTLPLILVSNLGFSVGEAQCLVAPPYVFAGLVMYATAWLGDRYRVRGPIILFNMVLCLVGLPVLGWARHAAVRYFGVFLVTAGANSNVPAVMALQANNVRGQWKRALSSATLVGMGGVGGIAGSLVFRLQDAAGGYKPGLWACIACALLNVVLLGVCEGEFWRQNRKADVEGKALEVYDDEDKITPGFRYTY